MDIVVTLSTRARAFQVASGAVTVVPVPPRTPKAASMTSLVWSPDGLLTAMLATFWMKALVRPTSATLFVFSRYISAWAVLPLGMLWPALNESELNVHIQLAPAAEGHVVAVPEVGV